MNEWVHQSNCRLRESPSEYPGQESNTINWMSCSVLRQFPSSGFWFNYLLNVPTVGILVKNNHSWVRDMHGHIFKTLYLSFSVHRSNSFRSTHSLSSHRKSQRWETHKVCGTVSTVMDFILISLQDKEITIASSCCCCGRHFPSLTNSWTLLSPSISHYVLHSFSFLFFCSSNFNSPLIFSRGLQIALFAIRFRPYVLEMRTKVHKGQTRLWSKLFLFTIRASVDSIFSVKLWSTLFMS